MLATPPLAPDLVGLFLGKIDVSWSRVLELLAHRLGFRPSHPRPSLEPHDRHRGGALIVHLVLTLIVTAVAVGALYLVYRLLVHDQD